MSFETWLEFHKANPFVLEAIAQHVNGESANADGNFVHVDGEDRPSWSLILEADYDMELIWARSLKDDAHDFVIRPDGLNTKFHRS